MLATQTAKATEDISAQISEMQSVTSEAVSAIEGIGTTIGEINKRVAGAYFSPRLFDNPTVKKVVGFVQRWLP